MPIPALNATLNAIATVLLCLGLVLIKRGRRSAHARVMVAATVVSAAFLCGYLYYHLGVQSEFGPTPYNGTGPARTAYLAMLLSHVVLAVVNVPLVVMTLWRAARGDFERHRRIARWCWPVWFYVSITGVLVYLVLYHWNPAPAAA